MAPRSLDKGDGIFTTKGWNNRKISIHVKLMNAAIRRASRKSQIPADILKFIATQK